MRRTDDARRALQAAVTRSLIENHELPSAIPRVLYAICERMRWSAAEVWCEDPASSLVRSLGRWPSKRRRTASVAGFDRSNHLTGLLGRVWSTGRALSTTNLAGDPDLVYTSAAFQQDLRWAFAFPLRSGERVRGVALFLARTESGFDASWRRSFEALGEIIAEVIAERQQEDGLRKRILEERSAREEAEAAHGRLAFLADATWLIASSLDLEKTFEHVVSAVVPALADWCTIEMTEKGRPSALLTRFVAYLDATGARRIHRLTVPSAPGPLHPLHRSLRTREGELAAEVSASSGLAILASDAELLKIMRDRRPTSLMVAPLVHGDVVIGGLTLASTSRQRRFTAADLALAEEVARRAAVALEHARAHGEALAQLGGPRR